MKRSIQMGNDEFILYYRKRQLALNGETGYPCNKELARRIYEWLKEHADATIVQEGRPCDWGETAANIDSRYLPMTATQFKFNRDKLPDLYEYLDNLN